MTRYFIGVDIGGSKSHALIASEDGQVVASGEGGPGNHEGVGFEGFTAILHQIVNDALVAAGLQKAQIAGIGLGIAGFDWPTDYQPHFDAISTLGIAAPFQFVNDAVIGLIAGAQAGWGVSVVCGTGNNCRGRDAQGREGRVAGVGYWTGEHGGGWDLILRAMEAISKAWTKRGPETALTEKFLKRTGLPDVISLLEGLSRDRIKLHSSDVMLVFETAAEGDAVAQEVIRWMGRELASLAIGVIRQLKFEKLDFEVVLTGSLYKGSPLMAEAMAESIRAVAPGAKLVPLTAPPVVGGVFLGMEQAGLLHTSLRDQVIAGAKQQLAGKGYSGDE